MAFSLRWLLALTAYTAIAAAAIATGHWAFADLVWAVTFCAIAYALVVALFTRGRGQVVAGGFAVTSLLLAACLGISPDSVPTARLIVLAAQGQPPPAPRQVGPLYATEMSPPESGEAPVMLGGVLTVGGGSFSGGSGSGSGMIFSSRPSVATTYAEQIEWVAAYRTANAVATMLAGLTGALLGAVAYRRHSRRD